MLDNLVFNAYLERAGHLPQIEDFLEGPWELPNLPRGLGYLKHLNIRPTMAPDITPASKFSKNCSIGTSFREVAPRNPF